MSSDVGIVCGRCDWFNPRDGTNCSSCGNDLSLFPPERLIEEESSTASSAVKFGPELVDDGVQSASGTGVQTTSNDERTAVELTPIPKIDERVQTAAEEAGMVLLRPVIIGPGGKNEPCSRSEDNQMEQARHYICKSCYSAIPGGHKFCGKCGAPTNFAEDYGATQYFGAMQVPNKAKLILIKGEGLDGISYHLNSTEHVAGRQQGAILFPDDPWLSPRHANFFYRDNSLYVRDEDSVNGVYIRIREPTTLTAGQMFMCGEQVFRVEKAQVLSDGPESDGTYFYASPTKNWSFYVAQILTGGSIGMAVHDENGKVVIGREDCDMNFLQDRYLSPKHAEVTSSGNEIIVTDLDTQNGTFVRIEQERALMHGDYVFLGKQLLRVEVTP